MKFLKKYCWILLLISISLVLRISIYLSIMNTVPFSDYFDYKQWIYRSYSLGFRNLYTTGSIMHAEDINQPPGTIYVLRASYEIFLQTAKILTHFTHVKPGATLWINDNLLIFFFRFPSIIADLLLGFCIYVAVRAKTNEKMGLISSAFYLLNPAIIYNSTVWGQVDSINNLLFYISLLFLLKKKAFFSILFFAFSLFFKFSLLPLIPLYVLIALYGGFLKTKSFLLAFIPTSVLILILCLPFSLNPFWFINFALKASAGQSQAITVNAFNFWWFLYNAALRMNLPDVSSVVLGLKLNTWGNLLFAAFYVPLLFSVWKLIRQKKLTTDYIFLFFAMGAFITFIFLPKMHERYLYPVFPLLITWVGIKNKYWVQTVFLSVLHFLNLYAVWNPNLFLFGPFDGVIRSQLINWDMSFATIALFVFFYIKTFTDSSLLEKLLFKEK